MFEVIDKERVENGYLQKNFRQYKNHCNRVFRELKKKNDQNYWIYKLESNLAKFFLFQSIKYLNKNFRILKKIQNEEFYTVYFKYMECFLKNKKNTLVFQDLVNLRDFLANYYTFFADLVSLNIFNHDFDDYRIHHNWQDITLSFDSKTIFDNFLAKNLNPNDYRFYNQFGIKIIDVERAQDSLKELLDSKYPDINRFFRCVKIFNDKVELLNTFLNDNFIRSVYVKDLYETSNNLMNLANNFKGHRSGCETSTLERFLAPKFFEMYQNSFDYLHNLIIMNNKSLKNSLILSAEKQFSISFEKRAMPFMPEFYDLAFDFIEYPSEDTFSEKVQNLNINE